MPEIKVKDDFVTKQILINSYEPKLIELYYCFEKIVPWFDRIITSGFRKGKGVHGTTPCRGIDLRCKSHWIGEYLEKKISGYWSYDIVRPHKKCVIFHTSTNENGYHLHLQVHPNTEYLGE